MIAPKASSPGSAGSIRRAHDAASSRNFRRPIEARSSIRYEADFAASHSASVIPLLLAQHEIQGPATPDVRPGRAQVGQDGLVGAAGVFEGVGEDRQLPERLALVD